MRLDSGRDLVLEIRPLPGETVKALAARVAVTPVKADLLAASLASPDSRTDDGFARVPLAMLSSELRAVVLRNVFPEDGPDGQDWVHVVRKSALPIYDEGLWQVAAWFTGDGSRFEELAKVNHLDSPELVPGERIRIPRNLLDPALLPGKSSDDGTLTYGTDASGAYAAYRIKPGEALYSAVVLRYTGRTSPDDVEALARTLAARSGIHDLTDIPVGWPIKIPLDLLDPEFLPPGDSRRKAIEKDEAAMAEELAERPPRAAKQGLDGVVVILDPGHGGLDPGTMNHGVWEHDYVFDVAERLRSVLESKTRATVVMTLADPAPRSPRAAKGDDALTPNRRREVMTTPPFLAADTDETSVAVNLRWYLANSVFRRLVRSGTDPDRVVFVSLHADSRHPSLRGAMVYVPGARYRSGTMGSDSATYRQFREVREQPRISFSRRDRIRSEAISRKLAASLVKGLRRFDLPVQAFQPVRERVIRGRQTWLPAVLKGNAVPAKVLIEMVNLNNGDDAAILGRAADRQRLADALAAGLSGYFGGRAPNPPAPPAVAEKAAASR